MSFSIREMLGLTFLVGVGLLAWRAMEVVEREKAELTQLEAEVKSLSARLRLSDPKIHQVMLHTLDEFASLRAARDRAVEHFDSLREKYSTMTPRDGDIFSLRGLPTLQAETGPAPIVFRMIVPAQRQVWLKFGVFQGDQAAGFSQSEKYEAEVLSDSPFESTGPYETRLPPGDQVLAIAVGRADGGAIPVRISLDDSTLLHSSFVSSNVSGTGFSYIAAPSQIDFAPRQDLPSLLSARMNEKQMSSATYGFRLWLSEGSSGFAPFPGNDHEE